MSLTERLTALEAAAQAGQVDTAAMQATIRERLQDWRALLRRHVCVLFWRGEY